jgi:hypothetical protein
MIWRTEDETKMTKIIAERLTQMSKDELIKIIKLLCNNKSSFQKVSLLVAPTQKDLERAISRFDSCCDRFYCNSESESTFDEFVEKANLLLIAADKAGSDMQANIYYEMLRSIRSYQLYVYCDDGIAEFQYCAEDELKEIIDKHGDEFSDAMLKKYKSVISYSD